MRFFHCFILVATFLAPLSSTANAKEAAASNLAKSATITASSEYSGDYSAKFVADGVVPSEGSKSADRGAAWCVRGEKNNKTGWLKFSWKKPVAIGELVYFGRTAWYLNECWKDYEVYIDGGKTPVVKGTFQQKHGAQKIVLPKTMQAKELTLQFTNSYGGFNPGALEVAIFPRKVTEKELASMFTTKSGASAKVVQTLRTQPNNPTLPKYLQNLSIDTPTPEAIVALIAEMKKQHGAKFPAAKFETRLQALKEKKTPAEQATGWLAKLSPLARLQRDILLFDTDKVVVIKRNEINASHVYTYHYEGQRNGGGLYLADLKDAEAPLVPLIETPDGQILESDLSYDGKTVLFSMRKGGRPGYHVYTIGTDGKNLTQLTDGPWHDYNACWLPDGGIAFLSSRLPQFAYCWHAPVGILYRMEADGSKVQKLSANYLNDFTPYVLDDGRIIYTRWEYVDRPAIPIQSLWTINPHGTGLTGYFGNRVLTPGSLMEPRSIPGTEKIICTMTGHNGPTRGAIGVIDRSRGVNAQEAIVNITPDTPIAAVNVGCGNTGGTKPYSCPQPLDQERFLVSARGPLLVRTIDGVNKSTALPMPEDGMQYFNAMPLRPRKRPRVIPPRYCDPELAKKNEAVLFLKDVYDGLGETVKRGEVKKLRVVRELHKPLRIDPGKRAFGFQFPVISCGATYAGKEVIGEIEIGDDGSACFYVPADIPIYFIALDKDGQAVQRMRSFTHLMPGETQGCNGCHDDRLGATRPSLGALGSAMFRKTPVHLKKPEWRKTATDYSSGFTSTSGFDYTRTVQPVLDKHCIKCHDSISHPKKIDLTGGKTDFFNVSYETLARSKQGREGSPYVSWIPTYNGQEWNILQVEPRRWGSPKSKLAEVVRTGHPDKDGKLRLAKMTDAEKRRIYAWIDLNVPYYGSSETAYPETRGCRQILPPGLDAVLADVGKRRCASCHKEGKIPRREWVRITEPELNPFLVAPLAKEAGGGAWCKEVTFKDKNDPDYQKILKCFEPVTQMLQTKPRMDMSGGKFDRGVNRKCE